VWRRQILLIEKSEEGASMLFMVIETFRDGDARPAYARFRESGRLTPPGLTYVDSWVDAAFSRCFQIMECDDLALLQEWVVAWSDLVAFEIIPIVPSKQAAAALSPAAEEPL
jgi:hypothetical protein